MGQIDRRNFLNLTFFASSFLSFIPWVFGGQLSTKNHKTEDLENPEIEWGEIRKKFMLTEKRTYFNTAGIGASPKIVIDNMHKKTIEVETIGETKHHLIEDTRQKIAQFFNVEKESLAIIRNTTEGINIAAKSLPLFEGDEIIITTHEHIGGAAPWIALTSEKGVKVKPLNLDITGENNLELFKKSITSKTKAICFSHVTCTTGLVLPAKEIIAHCRQKNIFTCVDGAQAIGMIDVDLNELNPDIYAFSGHKWLFGPNGSGVLYINSKLLSNLTPVFTGAYSLTAFDLDKQHIEYNQNAEMMEYGTRNAPQISAFGTAMDFIRDIGIDKIENRGREMARKLKQELQKNPKVELLTPLSELYSGSIVTFRVKNVPYLELQKNLEKNYKIRVRGIYENDLEAIRISCAIYNDMSDINNLIQAINETTND